MFHHVELYVSDIAQTRLFYDRLLPRLGWSLYQDWQDGFSYQAHDGSYLVFVQAKEPFLSAGYHRCHVGLNHLAFAVETVADVDALHCCLQEWQVPLLYEESYPYAGGKGHYALYAQDPDGIKIEIVVGYLSI